MNLVCRPIGFVRSPSTSKFVLEPQPSHGAAPLQSFVEVESEFLEALQDLEGFSRIWLIWWFHKNEGWRPRVLPPRGRGGRKGLFATRSPHRPNPLAISAVALLKVDGPRLYIGEHDLLDGTPILDLKPYIPRFDSFPSERLGWFADVDRQMEAGPNFEVTSSPLAEQQLSWLDTHFHADFSRRVYALLGDDPRPHRTRRIRGNPQEGYRLLSGAWRIFFQIEGSCVRIDQIASRFSGGEIPGDGPGEEDELHRRFMGLAWVTQGEHD